MANPAPNNNASHGSSFLGQAQPSANATSSSIFGSKKPLFGENNAASSGSGGFGQSNTASFGGFGNIAAGASNASDQPFSRPNPKSTDSTSKSAAPDLFGNSPDAGKGTATPSSFFGNFSTPNKFSVGQNTLSTQPATLFGATSRDSNSQVKEDNTTNAATPTTSKSAFQLGNFSTTPAGPPPPTAKLFSTMQTSNSGSNLFGASGKASQALEKDKERPAGNEVGSTAGETGTGQLGGTSLFGSNTLSATAPQIFGKSTAPQNTSSLFGSHQDNGKRDSPSLQVPESQRDPISKTNPFNFPAANASKGPANAISGMGAAQESPNEGQKHDGIKISSSTPGTSAPGLAHASLTAPVSASGKASFGGNAGTSALTQAPSHLAEFGQKKESESSSILLQQQASSTSTATKNGPSLQSQTNPLFANADKTSAKPAGTVGASTVQSFSLDTTNATSNNNSGALTHGASTIGPVPTPQSRLKNKSMDEIITRWAADLSKYQKDFQSQANQVAKWDGMLLENGNAISKLYAKTFQAERDTAEIQKQLSAVEGHQDELSQWLDRYERDVDEMTARQVGHGDGLQGPNQERERTYKIAERVSERLDDFGKDLTSMIEEINSASASINKTNKPDDPLSQIVRVLNWHLSQLQLIDRGTSELQARLASSQRDSQHLGPRSAAGLGRDATDDFYASWTSRG